MTIDIDEDLHDFYLWNLTYYELLGFAAFNSSMSDFIHENGVILHLYLLSWQYHAEQKLTNGVLLSDLPFGMQLRTISC